MDKWGNLDIDSDTLKSMSIFGGSFVKNLAQLYWSADHINKQILRSSFGHYFEEYTHFHGDKSAE